MDAQNSVAKKIANESALLRNAWPGGNILERETIKQTRDILNSEGRQQSPTDGDIVDLAPDSGITRECTSPHLGESDIRAGNGL